MSDPVTNVEIEDVLSSIRRLVSVDATRSRAAPEPEGALKNAAVQKLLLTEDYRIAPTKAELQAEQAHTADLARDYTRTLERRIAELEAAVSAQATEFEPDGSEDTSQHRPTAVLFAASRVVVGGGGDPVVQGADDNAALRAAGAQPATARTRTPEDAHADMWSADRGARPLSPGNEDGIEILTAESHRNARPPREDDAQFALSDDGTVIDEETLRDMVAEIVREELQGALGERITRNVRKLVRRETRRAISIRDFE